MSWLEPRIADAPESFRKRIVEAVKGGQAEGREGEQIVDELQRLGEELMLEAMNGPPTHDTAMTLLTADALITLACEAVAEQEPGKLGDLR